MRPPKALVKTAVDKVTDVVDTFNRNGLSPNEINQISNDIGPVDQAQEVLDRTQLGRVVNPARHESRNFSLKYIDTAEDVKTLLDDVSFDTGEIGALSKNKQSNKETLKLSEEGDDFEGLLKRKPGNWTAAQLTRGRRMLVQGAEELFEMAQEVKAAPGDVKTQYAFRKAVATHTALQRTIEGAVNEAGRVLQAMQIPVGSDTISVPAMEQKLIEFGSGRSTDKLADLIISTGGDAAKITDATRETWQKRTSQAIIEYYVNNLLWGFKTHAANNVGNVAASFMGVGERYTASGIGKARKLLGLSDGADTVSIHEANANMIGTIQGIKDSYKTFRRAFAQREDDIKENDMLAPGAVKTDTYYKPAITADNFNIDPNSTFGKLFDGFGQYYVRMPGKMLGAQDEVYKTIAYLAETNSQAVRAAISEGLDPGSKAYREKVNQIIMGEDEVYSRQVNEAGVDYAKYQTFTSEISDDITAGIAKISNSNPVVKTFVPFVRVISNLLKYGIERSPAAWVMPSWKQQFAKGGADRDIALAKVGLGSATSMVVYHGMMNTEVDNNGNETYRPYITGAGPKSRAMQKVWRENGIKPWSVYVDGKYVQYNRLDPVGQVIGQTAVAIELMNGMYNESDRQEAAFAIAVGLGEYLQDKTYFQGFAEIFDIMGGRRNPSSVAAGKVTSFSPGWLANVAKATDDGFRETKAADVLTGIIKKLESRVPGLREGLHYKVDMFGNDVINDEMGWYGYNLSPAQYSAVKNDEKVANELFEQGYGFMEPSSEINFYVEGHDKTVKVDLLAADPDGELFYQWQKQVGKARYRELRETITLDNYITAVERDDTPKIGRRWYLQRAAQRGKDTAKKQFIERYQKQLRATALEVIKRGGGETARPFKGDGDGKLERNPFK